MKRWFAVVVGLQILFLIAQMGLYRARLASGTRIRLHVVPVDPRSLMMGQYMDLGYDISTIDRSMLRSRGTMPANAENLTGRVVFAGMRPADPWAVLEGVWLDDMPAAARELVYLRGRVSWGYEHAREIHVSYGIERYYIPERRTQEVTRLERRLRSNPRTAAIAAEVAVDKNGRALIRAVLLNGTPIGF